MTSIFTQYTRNTFAATIDFENDDIRILLLMANNNAEAAASLDGLTVAAITTLDHFDGANYSQTAGLILASKNIVTDNATNTTKFDSADPVVSAMGAGLRNITGALLIKFVSNVASSIAISYHEFAVPFNGQGIDQTIEVDAGGWLDAS